LKPVEVLKIEEENEKSSDESDDPDKKDWITHEEYIEQYTKRQEAKYIKNNQQ
jgi:hypothetical protein